MKAPECTIVSLALVQQRLTLPSLAAKLGVPVAELVKPRIEHGLSQQLQALSQAPPAPLTAVADVVGDEKAQLRQGLLDDTKKLANQRLGLESTLPYMQEHYEVHTRALNELRLHVRGKVVVKHLAHLPVGNYKAARPLEAELEAAVKANNRPAQAGKATALKQAISGLDHIRNHRLPEYEAEFGRLAEAHDLLSQHDEHLEALQARLASYKKAYALLMDTTPLQVDAHGLDLSLKAQHQNGAKAHELVEAAMATAKAEQRDQERLIRQSKKARELEVFDDNFDQVLAQLEAGQEPKAPTITAAELAPSQLKGSAELPKPPKATEGMLLPKAPKVKSPAKAKEGNETGKASNGSKANTGNGASRVNTSNGASKASTGNGASKLSKAQKVPAQAAPAPAATTEKAKVQPTQQETPQASTSSSPTQGTAVAKASHKAHSPSPTAKAQAKKAQTSVTKAVAKTATQPDAPPEDELDDSVGFKDNGWRPKLWTKADEADFQKFFGPMGGVFPSKGKFKKALMDVMNARLERDRLVKRLLSEDPPT